MNTVMDDNKMLTLASNERIPLTPSMRLLLEINHMAHCSPATVSRGGVIFVNADDVGWKPVVDSWIERLEVRGAQAARAAPARCMRRLQDLLAAAPALCGARIGGRCWLTRATRCARQAAEYRPLLTTLFSKYVDATLEHCRRHFKTVVPLPAINQVRGGACAYVAARLQPMQGIACRASP